MKAQVKKTISKVRRQAGIKSGQARRAKAARAKRVNFQNLKCPAYVIAAIDELKLEGEPRWKCVRRLAEKERRRQRARMNQAADVPTA